MEFNIFSWNCQGARHPQFNRMLQEYLKIHHPPVVVLLETRVSGLRANKVIKKSSFNWSHRVEAKGFSSGIWIHWDESVRVEVLCNHSQFVHFARVSNSLQQRVLYAAVYGSSNSRK
ncbi:hypothetical protein PVK06_042304 [Gossypium arboreum]|uniref:Uncharacterized protein n=1 Tax=Gossypium arboreum TaxID=29729 RepID=A0ABR0MKB5_GOSAR|nr:hypothetical protein PVK06_042304 [Gossypium arboreum]